MQSNETTALRYVLPFTGCAFYMLKISISLIYLHGGGGGETQNTVCCIYFKNAKFQMFFIL
jgi:hypothetical protein